MSPSLILASLALTAPPAPMAWSPDGRWLAFVDEEWRDEAIPPRWLFDADRHPGSPAPRPARPRAASRLWATNPAAGESVLLDRTEGMHSAPAWGPGGMAIAFARLRDDAQPPALELVIVRDSPDGKRVLLSRPAPDFAADGGPPPPVAPAVSWSPDGQFLTLPNWGGPGFEVVRADTGKVVASYPGMVAPAWSPDGSKLAFLEAKPGREVVLCWSEAQARNAHRSLVPLGRAWQAPRWKADGKSIIAARVKQTPNGSAQGELLECTPETGLVTTLHSLIDRQVSAARPLGRIAWAIDADLDGLFYSATIRGQPSEIGYYLIRRQEPRDRFNPIDPTLPILELALSPDEGSLAIRFGTEDDPSPPAVFRREGRRLALLHPDRGASGRWLDIHLRAASAIVRGEMSPPHLGDRQVARASLIPLPDEDEANGPFRARLRHLAANGLEAIGEIARQAPAGEPDRLGEARLFFLALQGSWGEALDIAGELEEDDPNPGDRWLTLRAQLEFSKGDRESARGILGYLADSPPPRRIEETPNGPAYAPGPEPARWVALLRDRLDRPSPAAAPPAGRPPVGVQIPEQDFVPPVEAEMPLRVNF